MPAPDRLSLEVCVDTLAGIAACQEHVDRIELCSALALGGLTPSPGLFAAVATSAVPVHAMIRPRAGDFDFDAADQAACIFDIEAARAAGCAGVVIGVARSRALNTDALRACVDAAAGLEVTLHRVVDVVDDPLTALDIAISLGITRVLTSGGAPSAFEGATTIAAMHQHAAGRITIMAGSGVTPANVIQIAKATGLRHFHSSCSTNVVSDPQAVRLGFAPQQDAITDAGQIAKMRAAMDQI